MKRHAHLVGGHAHVLEDEGAVKEDQVVRLVQVRREAGAQLGAQRRVGGVGERGAAAGQGGSISVTICLHLGLSSAVIRRFGRSPPAVKSSNIAAGVHPGRVGNHAAQ